MGPEALLMRRGLDGCVLLGNPLGKGINSRRVAIGHANAHVRRCAPTQAETRETGPIKTIKSVALFCSGPIF